MKKILLSLVIVVLISSVTTLRADDQPQKQGTDDPQSMQNKLNALRAQKKLKQDGRFYVKGAIDIEGEHDTTPEFRVYFHGMETVTSGEGFFSFPFDNKKIEQCSLIITKDVDLAREKSNTIQELRSRPDKRAKQFTLTYHDDADGEQTWSWEEQETTRDEVTMSEHSIVVLVDPKYFSHLKLWEIAPVGQGVMLPTIVLKGDDRNKLERASAKSLLYSLNSKTFHETVKRRKKIVAKGKGVISLVD